MVVDCDKGLGDAIMLRSEVEALADIEIAKGFARLDSSGEARVDACKHFMQRSIATALENHAIPPALAVELFCLPRGDADVAP